MAAWRDAAASTAPPPPRWEAGQPLLRHPREAGSELVGRRVKRRTFVNDVKGKQRGVIAAYRYDPGRGALYSVQWDGAALRVEVRRGRGAARRSAAHVA